MTGIFGAPLIEIHPYLMPVWQHYVKRLIDIAVALLFIIIFSPVYIITALIIKMSSKGPVFFHQERIGQHGVPFNIYKFRSMYADAEKEGTPLLSSANDAGYEGRTAGWPRKKRTISAEASGPCGSV